MKLKNYQRYVPFMRNIITGHFSTPPYLLFFVTHRCNARCHHCFNWMFARDRKRSTELSLEEIEMFTRRYGRLMFLFLTGGEPFLRRDLPEIAQSFHDNTGVIKIQIPSNGFLSERIPVSVEKMLKLCPHTHISVTLSVDGIGEDHDTIRAVPGLFDRVQDTYFSLKNIEGNHGNFNVNVEVTVSPLNQEKLPQILHYLQEQWDAKNILCPLMRGNPRDSTLPATNIDCYETFVQDIQKSIETGKTEGYKGFPFARLATAKDTIAREIVCRTVRKQQYTLPCLAAKQAAVLLANGDVLPCEMKHEIMGNIRDSTYDMKHIMCNRKATIIREEIVSTSCFCTHECFLTMNLLFNKWSLLGIMRRAAFLSLKSFFERHTGFR